MRIPRSVNVSVLKTYEIRPGILHKCQQQLQSCNLHKWDEQIPRYLHELCIEAIAKNWTGNPILDEIILPIDRYYLLDILPTDLPLTLTVPKIPDDIYWKKCYMERWPKELPKDPPEVEIVDIVQPSGSRKLSSIYNNCKNDEEMIATKADINVNHLRSHMPSRRSSQAKDDAVKRNHLSSQVPSRRSSQTKNGIRSVNDHNLNVPSRKSSHTELIDIDTPSKSGKTVSEYSEDEQGSRTWKGYFLEMHIRDYLENLKPEEYDPAKIKELSDLCGHFVETLRLRQMQCSENSVSRIPLNAILTGFRNLSELSISFKQTYAGENFNWNILQISFQDIKLLAKGLEKCRLSVLRIHNSDVDCDKVIVILKSMLRHHSLNVLDFSHCKIADKGTVAIAKFSTQNSVKRIILTNNRIGVKGISAISYALCQPTCTIEYLDIKLNHLQDEGGNILMKALKINDIHLNSLIIGGCGLTKNTAISEMFKINKSLETLDISNNKIEEESGLAILDALQFNTMIRKLDVRMCAISSNLENKIVSKVRDNNKFKRQSFDIKASVEMDFCVEVCLVEEFETILLNAAT